MYYSYNFIYKSELVFRPYDEVSAIAYEMLGQKYVSPIIGTKTFESGFALKSQDVLTDDESSELLENLKLQEAGEKSFRKFFADDPKNGTFESFKVSFDRLEDIQRHEGDLDEDEAPSKEDACDCLKQMEDDMENLLH